MRRLRNSIAFTCARMASRCRRESALHRFRRAAPPGTRSRNCRLDRCGARLHCFGRIGCLGDAVQPNTVGNQRSSITRHTYNRWYISLGSVRCWRNTDAIFLPGCASNHLCRWSFYRSVLQARICRHGKFAISCEATIFGHARCLVRRLCLDLHARRQHRSWRGATDHWTFCSETHHEFSRRQA